jgi:2,3-bisphosphoglycerate-independent phosphoglycerate mutase
VLLTLAGARLRSGGELADLAPTCLDLLGMGQPRAMSGHSLLSAG